ncbi:PulJ/GspJ family protein [Deferribacter abyssi]|uniref:PulJ/GspJ family protein n=1 Tax=Deferribacter abyssi TaxID=213806 RepID=UPI003C253490
MNKKGLTLIELLIVLFLLAIILSAVYITFTTLLSDYRRETRSTEAELEKVVGLDIIRLDITHGGYGISDNETEKVFECVNVGCSEFVIRSTFNVTNIDTQSWIFVNTADNTVVGLPKSSLKYVYIDTDKKLLKDKASWANRPTAGKYIAFPLQDNATGCSVQTCTKITYSLSNFNLPNTCNPNTYKLLRAVNNSNGVPIIDCVADFTVRFDYDNNSDGKINLNEELLRYSDISGDDAVTFRKKLKRVRVFLLLQDGGFDRNFDFQGPIVNGKIDVDNDGSCDNNEVCLQLPNDYQHYRWKTVEYTIKPMDL